VLAEFLPQILFLCSVFGYLSLLMFIKVLSFSVFGYLSLLVLIKAVSFSNL
jgi:hypothetical protein